jgi:hypothetical protein
MSKTYTHVGLATKNGSVHLKVTNDAPKRVARLNRRGFTNPQFVELPEPMGTKDAEAWLDAQEGLRALLLSATPAVVEELVEEEAVVEDEPIVAEVKAKVAVAIDDFEDDYDVEEPVYDEFAGHYELVD